MRDTKLASMVADIMAVESMIPWPCPSSFAPDRRYELCEVVGATPGSLVYRARDVVLSDDDHEACVAIKITRGLPAGSREALMGRRVTHENVTRILGRGEIDESSYVIMEYVAGGTLADLQVPMPRRGAVELIEQIARGVHALHAAGVSHLDLKPSNVLLDDDGTPKVSDFGLSVDRQAPASAHSAGTLAFMAPEQYRGEPGAPPADIYALGGLLYYLLTGLLPNAANREQAEQILKSEQAIDRGAVGGTLGAICRRALSPTPMARHASAAHLSEELSRWRGHLPVESARPGPLRRLGLLVRRRTAIVVVVTSLALLGAGATVFVVRDQARELEAQKKAHQLAEQELEAIKSKGREIIRRISFAIQAIPSSSPTETVLPVLVWIEWLASKSVVSDLGDYEVAERRIPALQNMLMQYELLRIQDSVAAGLARYALAQSLLEAGAYEAIPQVLDDLESHWPGERRDNDAFWVSADVMRRASVLLFAADQSGAVTDDQSQELDALIEKLRATPDGMTTHNILRRAVTWRLNPHTGEDKPE